MTSQADSPTTPNAETKKSSVSWAPWLAVAIPVAAGIIYLLIWYGPDLMARHDIGPVTGPLRMFRLQQARDAARGRLLTLGAGLFAVGALIFTALNFQLLRRNSERADQSQRRTYQLTEQGQVTDRYTRAIEQLGSANLDVRIGGIYALGRVAVDSPRDHPTVMEVLAAFIREHSHEQWPKPESDATPANDRTTRPDIQAALTVFGRRDPKHDRQRNDLGGADLPGADLTGADLPGADLTGANLSDADLSGADLSGADLTGANLRGADLIGTFLRNAVLTGADVTDSDFTGADLSGADLTIEGLTDVYMDGTEWSKDRPVPKGWVRDPDSGQLSRAGGTPRIPGN